MLAPNEYAQDAAEYLDYKVDWSGWLAGGDTIVTSTFTADLGITLTNPSFAQTSATVWISGGVNGTSYNVVNSIVTAQGRKAERTLRIDIKKL